MAWQTGPNAVAQMTVAERDALIMKWSELTKQLAQLKAEEAELRKRLVDSLFDKSKNKGTEHLELGYGWKLTAQKKLNYSVDKDHAKVEAVLPLLPDFLRATLLKKKYELSTGEYNKLDDKTDPSGVIRQLVNAVLEIKPGTPELELKPPKENGNGNGAH